MHPLSCVNCCHNPLQLGPIGPALGYCTRHRVLLPQSHLTTCGQLLRKDLLGASAEKQRDIHRKTFDDQFVAVLSAPKKRAAQHGMTEPPNGQVASDKVIEEVRAFGTIDSKIATMAALRRIDGVRAEIAMLSLSRAYVLNCYARGGRWTAGLHVAYWTLERLTVTPVFEVTELRGPFANRYETIVALSTWTLVTFRLALLSDVASRAHAERDRPMGTVQGLVMRAIEAPPDKPHQLLKRLHQDRLKWRAALSPTRYQNLAQALHVDTMDT